MTSTLSVFIDESGTTNLQDNQGPTRYYVSTAVIVKTEDVPLVVKKLDEISSSFNGGTEFKNEKIRDDKRRIKLLNLISELPFQYFALVVDKQRIPLDSGLKLPITNASTNIFTSALRRYQRVASIFPLITSATTTSKIAASISSGNKDPFSIALIQNM